MPILYQWQPDEFVSRPLEEDASFWVSVQQCAARFAVAALLSITALSTAQAAQVFDWQQDDPALGLLLPATSVARASTPARTRIDRIRDRTSSTRPRTSKPRPRRWNIRRSSHFYAPTPLLCASARDRWAG